MSIDGYLTRSVRDTALLNDLTQGADLGAPYYSPPLEKGYVASLEAPPKPLRIAVCETTLTGAPIHPECRAAVLTTAKLLESLGHHVTFARPQADTLGMMLAWTKIVACGTALSVQKSLQSLGRALRPDDIQGVSRGAIAYAATVSGADYLDCTAKIHAYGREMAHFMQDHDILLTATLSEPPAKVGRFAHDTEDYLAYRTGPNGIFAYSPFCAAFNASGQPCASLPLHWTADNLPVGIHLAARFGADELLMSLCGSIEAAQPWSHRRPPNPA